MFLADVVGTVVSPVQIPFLDRRTLLLVRTLQPDGRPAGRTRVAIDTIGAGVGDRVLVIDEGNSSRQILDAPDAPVKTLVVGFVDFIELAGELVYDHRDDTPPAELAR
jgi:ethanolamine utilization protein EutN